jgi:hypothetical protein
MLLISDVLCVIVPDIVQFNEKNLLTTLATLEFKFPTYHQYQIPVDQEDITD